MAAPFTMLGIRSLTTRGILTLIAVCGVALGVAVVTAVRMINQANLVSFVGTVNQLAGRASLQITNEFGSLSEELVHTVANQRGVERAVPLVQGTVFLDNDTPRALTVLGIDVTDDQLVRTYEARAPDVVEDPLIFLSQPDSVIMTPRLAVDRGIGVGGVLAVTGPHGRATLRVRGLLDPVGVGRIFGGDLLLMDIQAAQRLLGKDSQVDQIDVVLGEGDSPASVRERLLAVLPEQVRVDTPRQRGERIGRILASFQALVSGLGALVLVVGGFSAYGTMAATLAARRVELAQLRVLGASRRQLLWTVLGEAGLIGLCGAILGLGLGALIGQMLARPVTESAAIALRLALTKPSLALSPADLATALALGVLTAFAAALIAAHELLGLSPLEALRGRDQASAARRPWLVAWVGLLLALASLCTMVAVPPGSVLGNGAAIVLHLSVVLLARPAILAAGKVAGRVAPVASWPSLGLAGRSLCTSVSKAATAAGILTLGLAVMVTVPTLETSLVSSLTRLLRDVTRADLIVSSAQSSGGRLPDPLDRSVADELRAIPGVASVETMRMLDLEFRGSRVTINALSPEFFSPDRYGRLITLARDRDAASAVARGEALLVSTNLATRHGIQPGEELTLATPEGETRVQVAGLVHDYFTDQGVLVMSSTLLARNWGDPLVNEFHVRVRSPTELDSLREAIRARLGERYSIKLLTLGEVVAYHAEQIGKAFRFMRWIEALVLLVTLVSLAEFQLSSVQRRLREMALLRAVGATRSRLRRLVLLEGAILGSIAAGLGLIAGAIIAVIWVRVGFPKLLGYVLELHFAYPAVLSVVAVALAITIGAYLIPAQRAARFFPARVLYRE